MKQLGKSLACYFSYLQHSIQIVDTNEQVVDLINNSNGYIIILSGHDLITSLSNIGPGINQLGPRSNYGSSLTIVKFILSFLMIAGRLEIFILFTPLMKSF